MAVKLNSTGGGSVTLDSPSTASNYTITLPSAAGTLATTTGTGSVFTNPTINGFTGDTTAITIGTTQFVKDTSGNVGIGTASPTALRQKNLEVSSSGTNDGAAVIVGKRGTGIATVRLTGLDTAVGTDINFNFPNTGDFSFFDRAANVTRMTLDSSGNVGIGTSSPATLLHLGQGQSVIRFGATSNGYDIGRDNSSGNYIQNATQAAPYNQFIWQQGGTERMRIDSSGALTVPNIYSNTTAAVTYVAVSSAGLLQRGGVSALKYKQDIRDLESIDITKFRPVRYKSKCENDDQTIDYFGFIADEVEEAGIKELITYNDDGEPEGFQYERMTVVLLKAIQELSAQNNALEARLAQLEAK